jgi:hypothetical protein
LAQEITLTCENSDLSAHGDAEKERPQHKTHEKLKIMPYDWSGSNTNHNSSESDFNQSMS